MKSPAGQAGFTLVELVVSIVVIGIAVAGVLLVMNYTTAHSADPMIQHQAVAIAEAYLEEILLRPFTDPDGADGEGSRNLFDDVDDYNNLPDTTVRDQNGTAIAGLGSYQVSVAVAPAILNGVGALRVDVTVQHPSGTSMLLRGYRTDY